MGMLMFSANKRRMGNAYVNSSYANNLSSIMGSFSYRAFMPWVLWLCIGFTIVFFIALASLQMYRSITTSSFFSIERINIYGSNFFSKAAILNETKLHPGMNSFSINISNIEKTLNKNPWVERVSVKRKLPGSIDIFITERKPMFWVLKDGLMFYADSTGKAISLVEPDKFVSLPTIEILAGGEQLLPVLKNVLNVFQETSSINLGSILAVRLSKSKGIEFFIEDHNLILSLGSNNWQSNLRSLWAVLLDLSRRGDLKKTSQVIASTEGVWVVQ